MFGSKKSKEEKRALKAEKKAVKERQKKEKAFKKQLRAAFNPKALKNKDVNDFRNFVLLPTFGISATVFLPIAFLDPTFILPTVLGTYGLLYAGTSGAMRAINSRSNNEPATWQTLAGQKVKGTVLQEAQYKALQESIFVLDEMAPSVKDPADIKLVDKLRTLYEGYKLELFRGVTVLDAGPHAASKRKITFLNTRSDIPKPPQNGRPGLSI